MGKSKESRDMSESKQSFDIDKKSMTESEHSSFDYALPASKQPTSPPPYLIPYPACPNSFRTAIRAKLDQPALSLFQLTARLLQLAFALVSGCSYAIELYHNYSASKAYFILAEVVFGLTLITLIVEGMTIRSFRYMWATEWSLAILWMVCFGIFYNVYLHGEVPADYAVVDFGRMEAAGWCNLVNALLWLGSALVSSVVFCFCEKPAMKTRLGGLMQKKGDKRVEDIERSVA